MMGRIGKISFVAKLFVGSIFILLIMLLSGCYHKKTPSKFQIPDSIQIAQIKKKILISSDSLQLGSQSDEANWRKSLSREDSIDFRVKHHYSEGFNFIVRKGSLTVMLQQPEEIVSDMASDSMKIAKGKPIVVADIRIMPNDTLDSVWVYVATEDLVFGWVREKTLLNNVDPDNPISVFISFFSNIHLLLFLIIICLMGVGYLIRKIMKRKAKIVHFNDINSVYPTLLALLVACAATLYASIQQFAPEMWREFYFHPSLNPFSQPLLLNIFLIMLWAMLLLSLAALDDIRRLLSSGDAFLYVCGLVGICAINYIVFSILTLYYIGYILLFVYIYFATKVWFERHIDVYECGNCGKRMHNIGRCPHCGVVNE